MEIVEETWKLWTAFKSAGSNDWWLRIQKAMEHVIAKCFAAILRTMFRTEVVPKLWNRAQCLILLKGWSWKIVDLLTWLYYLGWKWEKSLNYQFENSHRSTNCWIVNSMVLQRTKKNQENFSAFYTKLILCIERQKSHYSPPSTFLKFPFDQVSLCLMLFFNARL